MSISRMNDDNSDDKTEDDSHSSFISDKNGNRYAYNQKSPSPRNSSASHVNWNSPNSEDMVVDYEMDPSVDSDESIFSNYQCVEVLNHQKSGDFISNRVLETHEDPTCLSSALINTEKPKYQNCDCHSLEAVQDQSIEPSLLFMWKSNNDLNCKDYPTALELNQTFDIHVNKVNCTFITHHVSEKSQSLHTSGRPQPTCVRSGNTSSVSCSTWTSSHFDKMHMREINYNKESFENPQATPSEAPNTAFSDVVMQTDVVPHIGNQCQYSSGKVTSEYTDGSQQRLVGEKELQALTPVSDGVEVPSGSVLQEFYCFSKDEPNSETHSQSSYGEKELGQNLRETVSDCVIDDKCPLLVPAFDKNKAQVLNLEHDFTVTDDRQIASSDKDLGTQNSGVELILNSSPGQKMVSSLELNWDASDMIISPSDTVFMSTPILEPTNASFSILPVEATEKYNKMERSPQDLKNLPNSKGTPMNMSKPNLGKLATKTNSPIGSKVRKTEIISYPRPNFKNVKAKVMSRPMLQSKDPVVPKVTPKPHLTSISSPSTASSTRQLTVLSKTPRSDLNSDTKAEILINKTHKQQFNKLITGQPVHVTTHSKNASRRVPRTTSAMKSNQEDVDKASSCNSSCETESVAGLLQKIKGIHSVKMESAECLTYVPNIDGISPEKKGEKENGTPMEKQELKKEVLNQTFEYGSLFLVSESFCVFQGVVEKTGVY